MSDPNPNASTFTVAKSVLTDTEKDRFLACYFNLNDSNAINWDKASADFGSASTASFKKMIQTACKKVADAQANGGAVPPTPSKSGGGGGRKRKAAATPAAEGDDAETPVKKGKGRKKKADTPVEADDEKKGGVKTEGGDEDEEF